MATRPRLLFLSQCLPYPPHWGVATRTYNVLMQLQKTYDVDLLAFYRVSHQPDRPALESSWSALKRLGGFVAEPTPIPSEHSAVRKVWDHVRSVLTGRVYTLFEYDSRDFGRRLKAVLQTRAADLVHLDSLALHRWLPDLPTVPITCTHHDIDSDLLRQRAQRVPNLPLRHYFLLQADRLERLEREHPKDVISKMAKAERRNKVFVDWNQNDSHRTTVCVYSLRAKRERPFVSMPFTWEEIERACKKDDAAFFLGTLRLR